MSQHTQMKIHQNKAVDSYTELYAGEELIASWGMFEIPEGVRGRVEAMLQYSFQAGYRECQKDVRKQLGMG